MSNRELFESVCPPPVGVHWCDEKGVYVFDEYDGKYPDPGQNRLWFVWQAATEQVFTPVRGDSVSIDVSTDEATAANRVFGVLTGDNNGDRTWLADLDHFNYVVPNEVEDALRYYADPEHYWTETQSYDGKYISNGVTEETYHCSDATPDRAREALKLIESAHPDHRSRNNDDS